MFLGKVKKQWEVIRILTKDDFARAFKGWLQPQSRELE
jgi:hypothetical protein